MGLLRKLKYKRYRKHRKYQQHNDDSCFGSILTLFFYVILILVALKLIVTYWNILLSAATVIISLLLLYKLIKYIISSFILSKQENSTTDNSNAHKENNTLTETANLCNNKAYISKGSLMTDCEKAFFEVFSKIVKDDYIVQPQVNLASIISKTSPHLHQTELFRNIDFGIFDKSYNLKLLIEINDQTHLSNERRERDKKVHTICTMANIPIITFWTSYGINEEYIEKRLSKYLTFSHNENKKEDHAE